MRITEMLKKVKDYSEGYEIGYIQVSNHLVEKEPVDGWRTYDEGTRRTITIELEKKGTS